MRTEKGRKYVASVARNVVGTKMSCINQVKKSNCNWFTGFYRFCNTHS